MSYEIVTFSISSEASVPSAAPSYESAPVESAENPNGVSAEVALFVP